MRKYAPLSAEHPLVTERMSCPACGKTFVVGDVTALVAIGPGDDPEAQKAARDGRAYNAIASPAHYACVTGRPE